MRAGCKPGGFGGLRGRAEHAQIKKTLPVQPPCVPSRSHLPLKARADAPAALGLGNYVLPAPQGTHGPPSRNDHALLLRGVNELCRTTMGKGRLQRGS